MDAGCITGNSEITFALLSLCFQKLRAIIMSQHAASKGCTHKGTTLLTLIPIRVIWRHIGILFNLELMKSSKEYHKVDQDKARLTAGRGDRNRDSVWFADREEVPVR